MLRHEPGRILITAHRGVSGANIPCNTRTAFDIALAQGADILELDVARSRDGQLFVFHPGMEKPHLGIDAPLSELTAEEIRALRFLNQDNVPTSYGVVPLEEMFAHLRDKAYINVDKFWMWMEEITRAIRNANCTSPTLRAKRSALPSTTIPTPHGQKAFTMCSRSGSPNRAMIPCFNLIPIKITLRLQ